MTRGLDTIERIHCNQPIGQSITVTKGETTKPMDGRESEQNLAGNCQVDCSLRQPE